ncbi:hypothetical protein GCM10010515_20840 [Streptomyces fructofermentans]|uniref:Uncharacterized protein n=1 Tax=Streptomyces fructofermentans TaxID=152141 RepID=A0A918K8B2_9ACTN|nr:hypothetical protein GCM10010515_20840 [Streptomyces fructofermentans]
MTVSEARTQRTRADAAGAPRRPAHRTGEVGAPDTEPRASAHRTSEGGAPDPVPHTPRSHGGVAVGAPVHPTKAPPRAIAARTAAGRTGPPDRPVPGP